MIILILLLLAQIAVQFADVYTSALNNNFADVIEANRRYQLPSGQADIRKMAVEKAVFSGVLSGVSIVLYLFGAGAVFAALPLFVGILITVPTILSNYKIYQKHQ